MLSIVGNYELTVLYIGTEKTSLPPSAALPMLKSKGFWCHQFRPFPCMAFPGAFAPVPHVAASLPGGKVEPGSA